MVDLLVAWVWYPTLLLAICGGIGLLLAAAAGRPTGLLTMPLGYAGLVVVTQSASAVPATARAAAGLAVGLAVAGYVVVLLRGADGSDGIGAPAAWRRAVSAVVRGRAVAVSAVATFLAYAAPVVLSGEATVAGWIKLDDTATWLAFADRLAEAGRTTAGLAPSTYEAVLQINWDGAYPVGSFAPLGVTGLLGGRDVAWLFAPYLAVLAALLTLCLGAILREVVARGWVVGVGAWASSCAALLYGYAMWGGVKELALVLLLALVAALVPSVTASTSRWRDTVPLAVATAATFAVMGPGGVLWLAPAAVGAVVLGVRRRGWRKALLGTAAWAAVTVVASAATLALLRPSSISGGVAFASNDGGDIGNLITPLRFAQAAGIWPTGDFRVEPADRATTYLFVAVVAVAAVGGLAWCAARRRWELPLLAAAVLVPAVGFSFGNAWMAGKSLAVASPVVLAAAFVAVGWLASQRRAVETGVLAGVLVVGVVWSDVAQYHDVWLAPTGPLRELEAIGREYADQGPALMTEYSTYGARHFLRRLPAESASELRRSTIPLRDGSVLQKAGYADVDQFAVETLLGYPVLVLRRSATASRPPSVYRLDRAGEWYDVWALDPAAPAVLKHVPFGSGSDPVAVPDCATVRRLAAVASSSGGQGRVAGVLRPPNVTLDLSATDLPPGWVPDASTPGAVTVDGAGTLTGTVDVTTDGRYGLWLLGSFRSHVTVSVDGEEVYAGRMQLTWPGTATPVGTVPLTAGSHQIEISLAGGDLAPGSGGPPTSLGPLVLSETTADLPVTYVAPADAATAFCQRTVDWLEAVGGAAAGPKPPGPTTSG